MQSFRPGTRKQYKVYLEKWVRYAHQYQVDTFKPRVTDILHFFTFLYENGLGYSSLNTARSALSAAVELADSPHTAGTQPLLIRFLKGVFNTRPSLPRYTSTWDVSVVLKYLKQLPAYDQISLKHLSLKLGMLCLLVTGARGQSVHLLSLQHMQKYDNKYVFTFPELLKQSRPGKIQPAIEFTSYALDPSLCVVRCLDAYISKTTALRSHKGSLFISYQQPHAPVSRTTISRWIRAVMTAAGVDTSLYKPHSTRAASTSAAAHAATPLDTILKTAGWASASTFAKFYRKEIAPPSSTFSDNVLSLATSSASAEADACNS